MKSLADPTKLAPLDKKNDLLNVVIETPRKSRNKFAFDPDQEIFTLKSVLPAGMVFPYDFGFLPRTKADDGDPIDVLLLMDEPVYPGVIVSARLLGVIEGEQIDGKKKLRNDRLVAVSDATHEYAKIKRIGDLPKHWIVELETFFVNYHKPRGKEVSAAWRQRAEHRDDAHQKEQEILGTHAGNLIALFARWHTGDSIRPAG